jgi:hypothetical protein
MVDALSGRDWLETLVAYILPCPKIYPANPIYSSGSWYILINA